MSHTQPKASVEKWALLVNRTPFLLFPSLFDPSCLISSSTFVFFFLPLAPGTNPILFACTTSHYIIRSVSPVSSCDFHVLPYHQATSQLIVISLANPPLLPMCLAWIFLAPTSNSSPRFFLLLSTPETFMLKNAVNHVRVSKYYSKCTNGKASFFFSGRFAYLQLTLFNQKAHGSQPLCSCTVHLG